MEEVIIETKNNDKITKDAIDLVLPESYQTITYNSQFCFVLTISIGFILFLQKKHKIKNNATETVILKIYAQF